MTEPLEIHNMMLAKPIPNDDGTWQGAVYYYWMDDGNTAVVLQVFTNIVPDEATNAETLRKRKAYGSTLAVHTACEQIRQREKCLFLDKYCDTNNIMPPGSDDPSDLVRAFDVLGGNHENYGEQPPEFWAKLKALLEKHK